MKIVKWETELSNLDNLYFVELKYGESRFLVVRSSFNEYFEISLELTGLHVLCDEEYLTKYWSIKDDGIGWTFSVQDSELIKLFPGVMEDNNMCHFVISTDDVCVEIVSTTPPKIKKRTVLP